MAENTLDVMERLWPGKEPWRSEATWVLFKEEPGMDDIYQKAGDSLDKMFEEFKIYPVTVNKDRMLYLGRFEIAKYGEELHYREAAFAEGKVVGFMDFLAGFPIECTEIMAMVGEISSRADLKAGKLAVVSGGSGAAPSMPKVLFEGYQEDKILLNYLYLDTKYAQTMVRGLSGEPKPTGLRWWVRINFLEDLDGSPLRFPYPGEFLALAVRLMPDRFWDRQESNPFLFSGNWLDTVYYSSVVIKEVKEPTDERPYPLYTVQWRKEEVQVKPSDFAEYKVGDRVTILKDVAAEKESQRWKDEDMEKFDEEKWVIAPLTFYGIDPNREE